MRPALALGLAILCCIPWTIRNYSVFQRLVPLRSNFPLELYIGNNENYDDKHPRYPGPITKERETFRYFRMGETAFMDEEMRKATTFIVTHPRVEVILFGKRFVAFWAGIPNPIDQFLEKVRREKGLKAAPRADRITLLRRAYMETTWFKN